MIAPRVVQVWESHQELLYTTIGSLQCILY